MKITEAQRKYLVDLSSMLDVMRSSGVLSEVMRAAADDAAYLIAELRFGDDRRTEAALQRVSTPTEGSTVSFPDGYKVGFPQVPK